MIKKILTFTYLYKIISVSKDTDTKSYRVKECGCASLCSIMIVLLIILLLYLYGIRNFNYWRKRRIKNPTPIPYVGNNLKQFLQKASISMMAEEVYVKYPDEKVVGFFRGSAPELVIRDPQLMKRILVSDFRSFHGRGLLPNTEVIEPLLKNIFFVDGDLWKLLRQRFSLAFTTAEIKSMFAIITHRTEKLQQLVEEIEPSDSYDAWELMARYTIDFIGTCGFGIDVDSMNDANSIFRKLARRMFLRTPLDATRGALKFIFPHICKHVCFLAKELDILMNDLIKLALEQRNYKPSGRNDFIDIMLELKSRGKVTTDSIVERDDNGSPKRIEIELSDSLLVSQIFLFFGGGFETSSVASSHTLHQLAYHKSYQRKVQEEIDMVLEKHRNKITYDAVNEMSCLERAFYESLRLFPPVAHLMRQSASKYTFPELNLTIDEGVKVIIPIKAIFRDDKYFEDPDTFSPDRFIDMKDFKNNIFIPFGDGPRTCVASRLGYLLSMAGLAAILHKFEVEPSSKTLFRPQPDPASLVTENFANGLPLKFSRRKQHSE